jgi:hypothetical protein
MDIDSTKQYFDQNFLLLTKMLIDFTHERFQKSIFFKDFAKNTDFEVAIFSCAVIWNLRLEEDQHLDHLVFKEHLIQTLTLLFLEHGHQLSFNYLEKRLFDYQIDLKECTGNNSTLPFYSYFSFFKSPLKQVEIENFEDLNKMELLKFKLFICDIYHQLRRFSLKISKTNFQFFRTRSRLKKFS